MKEWHRTVILVLLLVAAIALIVMSRQVPEANLIQGF
jgi:hypothetical protein